ncbi:hypothetical protein C0995_007761 [Termitomyces sp. Mi166|nr:hypothetical protein C0995_007761 [Termitomyces sp. Mi166\
MRSYAGDTSLPGGRAEPDDRTIEDTARREAFEEIGLPPDRQKVPFLCILEPFVAGNATIVTPVTLFMQPILNDAEVASLFSHPLASFLSTKPPFPAEPELLEVPYHSYNDWTSPGPNDTTWITRSHRFLTGREVGGIKPVFGLTANIMIRVSTIAYGRPPEFDVYPPGVKPPTLKERLAWALLSRPQLREACQKEGLGVDWDRLRRIAGVKEDAKVQGKERKDQCKLWCPQVRKADGRADSAVPGDVPNYGICLDREPESLNLIPRPSLWCGTARMPAPAAAAAITVAAIVSAVAVGIAFKQFVYEPHLAPRIERWAEGFLTSRQAQRRQRAVAVPVLATPLDISDKRSDSDSGGDEERQSIELGNSIAKEVREWRSEVDRSQTLRRRGKPGSSGSQYSLKTFNKQTVLTTPTHVLVDPSAPSTPSSTMPSIEDSPVPHSTPLREASSSNTFRSPPPSSSRGLGLLPTPAMSSTLSPTPPQHPSLSPGMIPSLSQSFPLELDQEHGIELLSAPSSRPDSPFSTFSEPLSPSIHSTNLSTSHYYSFSSPNALSTDHAMSPSARPSSRGLSDLDLLSDLGSDRDVLSPHWSDVVVLPQEGHNFDDRSSDSSWTSAGARSR